MSHVLGELYFHQTLNPNIPHAETTPPNPNKPSYIITISPRVRALNEVYKMVKPNGNFQFDTYWQAQNKTQKELIGMIGRLVRFKPEYIPNFVPYVGLFSNMNDAEDYLKAQKIEFTKLPKDGNALVVVSKLNFQFPVKPTLTSFITADSKFNVKALKFTSGFQVLQSLTVQRDRIFQIPTTNPRVILNIFPTYQPQESADTPNQPVYDFLRFRRQRLFYTNITYQYKSISIPQVDVTLKEDTKALIGLYLLRVNYKTNNTNAIAIQNFIQYTNLKITQDGFSTESKTQTQLKEHYQYTPMIHNGDYALNTSFMIWAEHLDIPAYPLFIGYLNEKNFSKEE